MADLQTSFTRRFLVDPLPAGDIFAEQVDEDIEEEDVDIKTYFIAVTVAMRSVFDG